MLYYLKPPPTYNLSHPLKNIKDERYLWQRFLLANEIYYPYGSGINHNFLSTGSNNRDYGWKRFFDFSFTDKQAERSKVFEKIKEIKESISNCNDYISCIDGIFRKAIDGYNNEGYQYYNIIKEPRAIEYCRQGFFQNADKTLYLIRDKHCSGKSSPEIKSYIAYLKDKDKNPNAQWEIVDWVYQKRDEESK